MTTELDPSTRKILRNIERTTMKAQANFAPFAKQIEQIQKSVALPYLRLSEQIQQSVVRPYIKMNEQILQAFKPYFELNERINQQIQSSFQPYFRTIRTLQEHIDNISKISGPIAFTEALEEVSRVYEEAQKETKGNQEESLNIVVEKIEVEIIKQNKGSLSLELLVSLLFSLLLFWASMKSSAEAEERTHQKLSQIEYKIEQLASFVEQLETETIHYSVERRVNLRSRPSTKKSIVLETLPIGLEVELVQRKNKWIFVRYIYVSENIYKYGWVSKKHLKRAIKTPNNVSKQRKKGQG